MKKRKNKFILMLAILVSCICALPVVAAPEERKGTIEIKAKAGIRFEYSKIGEVIGEEYVLKTPYEKSGVDLNCLEYAQKSEQAAKKLNQYMKPEGSVITGKDGNAKIKNLSQGIYLVRYKAKPMLVTMPLWDETVQDYIYDVTIIPKFEEVSAPQTNLYSPMKAYLVITMMLLICAAMFSQKARLEYQPYKASGENRKKLREMIIEAEETSVDRKIDFEKLKEENPDIYGWIYIPGTQIDDPILVGKTDTEYLYKDFRGEKSALGAVFAFQDTAKDFSDAHICLFGHNMSMNQMFGELKKYRDGEFLKEHPEIYLYTENCVKRYEIFSVYDCEKTDFTFVHKMKRESEEYITLLEWMMGNNTIEGISSVNLEESNQILTLASCSDYRETANRFTVNAILKEVNIIPCNNQSKVVE